MTFHLQINANDSSNGKFVHFVKKFYKDFDLKVIINNEISMAEERRFNEYSNLTLQLLKGNSLGFSNCFRRFLTVNSGGG